MTTRYIETETGFKAKIDLDANNQIAFFNLTIPRRELDEEDFRALNKAIENLNN